MNNERQDAHILDRIVAKKKLEIAEAKKRMSFIQLEESDLFYRECYSLKEFSNREDSSGIIAEFKRASPSKGVINHHSTVKSVTAGYVAAGAVALSVLTDNHFFGGSYIDLLTARKYNQVPILRKDFMLDEYQILEAKAWGADIILLIASILHPDEIMKMAALAKSLGLSVLLEVHNQRELERGLCDDLDAVGINNRNLNDFSVSLDHSYNLISMIPDQFLKVSESGISDPETIRELKKLGFTNFLIGETFMKEDDPAKAIEEFVIKINRSNE